MKNKIIVGIPLCLYLSWSAFGLETTAARCINLIKSFILLNHPVSSHTYGHIYNGAEFIELLLSQPVARKKWMSLFIGLRVAFIFVFNRGIIFHY